MPHMRPSTRIAISLLAGLLSVASPRAQQPKPESEPALRVASSSSLQRAVKLTLAALKPHQKSLVRGTAKDSLFLLMPEWGSDIQELLGLNPSNVGLATELCAKPCSVEEATLLVMEAAHEVLLRSN
jgi:hypothetical protein